jgi:signal transduction histidine kinase
MVALTLWGIGVPSRGAETPVVSIATIRDMTAEQAAQRGQVRIRAVITLRYSRHLIVQDESGAIWVAASQAQKLGVWEGDDDSLLALRPGCEVEIGGITDQGGFAPVILPRTIRNVGSKPLPRPRATTDERFFSGCDNCLRIEMTGVVQGFRDKTDHWLLLVARFGRRFEVEVPKAGIPDPAATLVDAVVRMSGVTLTNYNFRGEALMPRIEVADVADIQVEAQPRSSAFQSPKVPLRAIAQFRPEPLGDHRILTEGTVTHCEAGQFFFVQDGIFGVRVETASTASLEPGDRIEITAFLDRSHSSAGLTEAAFRVIGRGALPAPKRIGLARVVDIINEAHLYGRWANPGDYNGCIVEFPARLLDAERITTGGRFILTADDVDASIIATLSRDDFTRVEHILPGSDLLVRGILVVESSSQPKVWKTPAVDRLMLIIPSAADVTVLRAPPWWTPRRLLAVLLAVAAVATGSLTWAGMLRRQVACQTTRLAREMQQRRDAAVEFQATQRERNRLAANLHDTLLQALAGAVLQIDVCKQSLQRGRGEESEAQLEVAKRMVRHAASDLRGSVWALRVVPLAGKSFVASLEALIDHLGDRGGGVKLHVQGDPFEPPRFIAGNLILVVQEAVQNALHHGAPNAVEVTACFHISTRSIDIAVRDDGQGFIVGTERGPGQGHFGLQGMRERIERLGGQLVIESTPSQGTVVAAYVSIREHDEQLEQDDTLVGGVMTPGC